MGKLSNKSAVRSWKFNSAVFVIPKKQRDPPTSFPAKLFSEALSSQYPLAIANHKLLPLAKLKATGTQLSWFELQLEIFMTLKCRTS